MRDSDEKATSNITMMMMIMTIKSEMLSSMKIEEREKQQLACCTTAASRTKFSLEKERRKNLKSVRSLCLLFYIYCVIS